MFLSPQILDILLRNWKSLGVEGKVSGSCGGMLQNSFSMWAPRAVSVQKANAGWKNMFLLALVLSDFQSSCLWNNSSWRFIDFWLKEFLLMIYWSNRILVFSLLAARGNVLFSVGHSAVCGRCGLVDSCVHVQLFTCLAMCPAPSTELDTE